METGFEKFSQSKIRGAARLIFATVGSSKTPFDRMVRAVDHLASKISEQVIIQRGVATYKPKAARYFDFCNSEQITSLVTGASTVIAHAGFGIISECIRQQKRLILIPREHRYSDAEGIQIELAEYLAENVTGIVCVTDGSKLLDSLNQVSKINPQYRFKTNIPAMVKNYIDEKLRFYN